MVTEQQIAATTNWGTPPRTFTDKYGRHYTETSPGQITGPSGGTWNINEYLDALTLTSPYIITEDEEPW